MTDFKNVKKFITGGCSFTAGHELADFDGNVTPKGICHHYSSRTWDCLIHRKLFPQAEMRKTATGGHGFGAITRRVIYECEQQLKKHSPEEIVVMIMWTSALRREFVSIQETHFQNPEEYYIHSLPGIMESPAWKDHLKSLYKKENLIPTVREFYYKRFTRDNVHYYSLQQYEYLTMYLKSKGIKFYYTGAFNDFIVAKVMQDNNIFIKDMFNRLDIENNVFFHNRLGFNDWAEQKGLPLGKDSAHPLEQAHLKWSKYFLKFILDKELNL